MTTDRRKESTNRGKGDVRKNKALMKAGGESHRSWENCGNRHTLRAFTDALEPLFVGKREIPGKPCVLDAKWGVSSMNSSMEPM